MSRAVIRESLSKIKKLKDLNAFSCLRDECELLKEADELELNNNSGLAGQPVAVKDNFCVRGLPATCGSEMLRNFVPTFDATVVERTRNAGCVIVGKTNMDEFGMGSGNVDSIFGPVKSIWRSGIPYELDKMPLLNEHSFEPNCGPIGNDDDWVIAGGSSGGSASAVATGMARVALGSDTGGSVRIPGAWCGLVTLKPTYGLLSRHGLIPLVNSLDVPAIFGRSVDDVTVYLNILKGTDPKDSTTLDHTIDDVVCEDDLTGLTIGIPLEYHCQDMSYEVLEAWSQVADLLQSQGVTLKSVSLPHTKYSITCYQVLNPCEVASNMARYDGLEYGLRAAEDVSTEALFAASREHGFNHVVRGRILAGNYFLLREHYDKYFIQALKVRRLISQEFSSVFQSGVDLLLTPVTLTDAPSHSSFVQSDNRTQTAKQDYCTQPVNLAGLPAATIPVKLSQRSLPISLQIIGRHCREKRLLSLCKWLEKRLTFPSIVLK